MVTATSLPRPLRRRSRPQGRSGPCASAARSGRRFTGARGAWRPSAREVGALLAGVDARRTWRPSRGVRGAAVTATSWGWGRVDDNGWRGCGTLQERRQIRRLIVFARTRTHRDGILTPGPRSAAGQHSVAAPRPVRIVAVWWPRLHAGAGLTLRPTAPSKLLLERPSRNTFAHSSLCHKALCVGGPRQICLLPQSTQ